MQPLRVRSHQPHPSTDRSWRVYSTSTQERFSRILAVWNRRLLMFTLGGAVASLVAHVSLLALEQHLESQLAQTQPLLRQYMHLRDLRARQYSWSHLKTIAQRQDLQDASTVYVLGADEQLRQVHLPQ